jgi:hypothetical protein
MEASELLFASAENDGVEVFLELLRLLVYLVLIHG